MDYLIGNVYGSLVTALKKLRSFRYWAVRSAAAETLLLTQLLYYSVIAKVESPFDAHIQHAHPAHGQNWLFFSGLACVGLLA
jgi:hypothetical protein